MASGAKDDPWVLTTPPGSSEYTMYKDEGADPPALVCQVGSTTLRYHLRAIEDLHTWLAAQGGWVLLGAADEKKRPLTAPSRRGDVRPTTRWAAGTGCVTGTAGGSVCISHPCSKSSAWPK
jgi:hypothetical protein